MPELEDTIATLRKRIPFWLLPLLAVGVVAIALYARSGQTAQDAESAAYIRDLQMHADPDEHYEMWNVVRKIEILNLVSAAYNPEKHPFHEALHERGTPFDHYGAVSILALQLITEYGDKNNARLSVAAALELAQYGGGGFYRYDKFPYRMHWYLRGIGSDPTDQIACAFRADDWTNRCTLDLLEAASFQWGRYARWLNENGMPGIAAAGADAIVKAADAWGEGKQQHPHQSEEFEASETAGDYTITVKIIDNPGSPNGEIIPFGQVEFLWTYEPH